MSFERFCSPQEWLGPVDLGCVHWRSCTPSTSGARLKVEKSATDPQRNCLDWRSHHLWWINSVRKSSGNIFEGWWFFCYVFTHCWLLSCGAQQKLTPCTKLADTTWKTWKTALKTDLHSWTNFQLAFLQLMYLRAFCLTKTQKLRWTRFFLEPWKQEVLRKFPGNFLVLFPASFQI